MIDAVRYVVDNGVKWANLPCDFPPFKRVHAFARRWQIQGLLTELHDRLRDRVRQKEGRAVDPTAAIVDSQSLRAAANIPRSTSGWDGGKKVAGRKRHLVVDCLGLVLVVMVTAASVQDRDAAVTLLERLRKLYFSVRLVWADGGYAGRLVDWAAEKLQLALEIAKRSDDTTGFVVLPRRWVVERTLSWLMRSRRLVRDVETLPAMHEAIIARVLLLHLPGSATGEGGLALFVAFPRPRAALHVLLRVVGGPALVVHQGGDAAPFGMPCHPLLGEVCRVDVVRATVDGGGVQLLPGLLLTPFRFRDLGRDLRHAQSLALAPDRSPGHIIGTSHHALPSCAAHSRPRPANCARRSGLNFAALLRVLSSHAPSFTAS
jgi:transposase